MLILIMGTAGSGKTTVGTELARQLGWPYIDADDFHSVANVEKMRGGTALSDEDRRPWLEALRREIDAVIDSGGNAVLGCSAFRQSHREVLLRDGVQLVYLKGTPEMLRQRLLARTNHFAREPVLNDQLARLEEPEDALVISIEASAAEIASEIRSKLALASA